MLAASVAAGAPAAAQRPQTLYPYRVEPIGQVLLPDIVPPDGRERTVASGEIVLRGRLAYRTAATVVEPMELVVLDQPIRIMPGEILAENVVTGGASSQARGGRFFCASLRRPLEPPGTPGNRFQEAVQPCFVDRDRDGRFDFALLVGARRQAELGLVPIAATAYTVRPEIPLPGMEVQVLFNGEALVVLVEVPSIARNYMGELLLRDADGNMRGFAQYKSVRKNSFPYMISFQSARIEILGYDRETRRARLRVLEGFSRADAQVTITLTYGRRR
jgi:hypothetical protein